MSTPLRIAVAGLGTVGAGTLRLLSENAEAIAARAGRAVQVTAVSARDRTRDRGIDLSGYQWFDDPVEMAARADADVMVELIGGSEGPAKEAVEAALSAGRSVVTANKALLAHHGTALARQAEGAGCTIGYEAAVAGGIPIIKGLREGLAGNRISRVYGILNGTCNYILTQMSDGGGPGANPIERQDFDAVLAEAQRLGYAEADPGFDIDGVDTAHKLAILTALAFGCEVDFDAVYVEGIRNVSALDVAYAEELGYCIKLLGVAQQVNGAVEQRVHPCMVRKGQPIASVDGVFNAVVADGDFVDTTMYEGRGAGAGPTASAVVADLIDIARGATLPVFGIAASGLRRLPTLPMERHSCAYYLRLLVLDKPGVIADVSAVLRDAEISMESMLQRGRAQGEGEAVPVIIMTHETTEAAMQGALARFADLEATLEPPQLIRIVDF
ncbi:homoserine dehydrogenase [Pelagibius litoralis]|uniref:Homoserine dehydrogenase n=1 Tax=Pelagibius litoralis TaxID=374515 RepID=A0A967C2H6_9PROT|nr:homoserine dehydrogenase [Pelagibius litoralis]NIA67075.1 homoserine dehydrogenase [Pelagibius litoralis]